jgi:hypothetical protein
MTKWILLTFAAHLTGTYPSTVDAVPASVYPQLFANEAECARKRDKIGWDFFNVGEDFTVWCAAVPHAVEKGNK